jgi:hypothetical protein
MKTPHTAQKEQQSARKIIAKEPLHTDKKVYHEIKRSDFNNAQHG